jgi:hypothetical protein
MSPGVENVPHATPHLPKPRIPRSRYPRFFVVVKTNLTTRNSSTSLPFRFPDISQETGHVRFVGKRHLD